MEIKHLTTPEILALIDNRFDLIIDDAMRHGSELLSWDRSLEPTRGRSEAYLTSKLEAVKGIRFLLSEYERRIKSIIKDKNVSA